MLLLLPLSSDLSSFSLFSFLFFQILLSLFGPQEDAPPFWSCCFSDPNHNNSHDDVNNTTTYLSSSTASSLHSHQSATTDPLLSHTPSEDEVNTTLAYSGTSVSNLPPYKDVL
jgi:hypothetical protein